MNNADFVRERSVLITGASGLLGSAFVRAVAPHAKHVRLVRHRREIEAPAAAEIVTADLTTRTDVERVCAGMDVVIHAAAQAGGSKQVTVAGREMFTESLLMNTLVLDSAQRAGAGHYLFLSNSSVYAKSSALLNEDDAWGDTSHGIPENETGMVKRVGETQCALYARTTDMRIAVMRGANAYGPHDNFDLEASHVMPALIRRAVERQAPYALWGDGSTLRDFIHTDDLAAAGIALLAQAEARSVQPVNVGTGVTTSIREIVDIVLHAADFSDAHVEWSGDSPPASPAKRLDLTRMHERGIAPRINLGEGISQTVSWYRNHAAADARTTYAG